MSQKSSWKTLALAVITCTTAEIALAGATIEVKLPYNIAYDLSPIQVDVKGAGSDSSYRVFDTFKNEIAAGSITNSSVQTVTFTPPRFGWYIFECGAWGKDHMTYGTAKFIGVTPKYANMHALAAGETRGGWNDEAMQAFTGLLMDRTNTRIGFQNADRVIADCAKYGITLLMQLETKEVAQNLNLVKDWVTRYKGKVKYWEIVNEPNFSMNPKSYAELVKQTAPVIKHIDPGAVVMGCDVCGMQIKWYEEFYKNGGAKFLDAISIHDYEGHESVDYFFWNYQLGELRKLMTQNGDANKPIWQTERAIGAVHHGFCGASQALRITLQRDIMETWGIPNNHVNHYYANVTGYNDVPTFVFSESGPHQAALVCRTRTAMIRDKKFAGKIDFGPAGNKIFLGLRYQGASGSVIVLRNLGCLDIPLEVKSGGSTLNVIDAFGNTKAVPVTGGKAVLTVSQWPCYLQQNVAFPSWNFGKNIASEAKFTYSLGSSSDPKILTDGHFQSNYATAHPGGTEWTGSYPGKTFDESPQTLDIAFSTPRTIDKMLLFSAHADDPYSCLLDYDLQYSDGKDWVTIEEVRTPCPPSDVVSTYLLDRRAVMWFPDNNFFVHQFKKPVTTDKLRLVVHRITRGCLADMIAEDAVNDSKGKSGSDRWKATGNLLEFREIEIYEAPGQFPAAPKK